MGSAASVGSWYDPGTCGVTATFCPGDEAAAAAVTVPATASTPARSTAWRRPERTNPLPTGTSAVKVFQMVGACALFASVLSRARLEATGARRRDDALRIATWRLDGRLWPAAETLATAADSALTGGDAKLGERLARAAITAGGGLPAGLAEAGWPFSSGSARAPGVSCAPRWTGSRRPSR